MKILSLAEESGKAALKALLGRGSGDFSAQEETVKEIIQNVRDRGDAAVFEYTEKFDGVSLDAESLYVSEEEIREAEAKVDGKLMDVMRHAAANIRVFHEEQKRQSFFTEQPGRILLGVRITPLQRAGVYVPGGKAAYPSSVLMNIIPAKVAGVSEIIMATPCGKDGKVNPVVLAAASIAGADKIIKTGGAQAIAAMAYGTESIPKVDKITGPGNIYVALAKRMVYGAVGIDSVAGPSEILVLAEDGANPRYIAADLLSQAEHDELASAVLITTSKELAKAVEKEIEAFLPMLPRRAIIEKSLENYGAILIASSIEEGCNAVNEIAPEHLEILTKDPLGTMSMIRNAGAIFLGEYSSEPLGDYFAGSNHILPTNQTARFSSPLGVDDFIKRSSVIRYSREALSKVHEEIEEFARREGLNAHENSIKVRFE
ncbi:MAG: histidinol dehydrogenase [Lachnospiraceae bacterium]|nr:histidinol dehydrogenase [Lachnospiraceae bacterium]